MLKYFNIIVTLVVVFSVSGCFGSFSDPVGVDVSALVFVDDGGQEQVDMEKGELFGVDVPYSLSGGFCVTGASFDPALFRMERYLRYESEGQTRVRYLFISLADGSGEVSVKMRPAAGGKESIYRTVRVVVGGDTGLF